MGEGEKGNSMALVNVGELAAPVDTFIKKVARAIGSIWRPRQIRRDARAEATAAVIAAQAEAQVALIKAQADIEVTELHRRSIVRRLEEDARQQRNIETLVDQATPLLTDGAKPDEVDDDWVTNFFAKSRDVSNEDMQQLWSRVLAGEFNKPGTFSRRTVNALADLDHRDCLLFARLCNFVWTIEDFGAVPLVFDTRNEETLIYADHDVTYPSLMHLQAIGLIQFSGGATGYVRTNAPKQFSVTYQDVGTLQLTMPEEGSTLRIGKVMLTTVGQELFKVCQVERVPGLFEYVVNRWSNFVGSKANGPSAPDAEASDGSDES